MAHLQLMQRNGRTDSAKKSQLIVGPWNHPGLGKRAMGGIDFGPQAEVDLTGHIIRWFDYWLKDIDNGVEVEPAVRYFCMGAGAWRTASTWPPEGLGEAVYYLHSEGQAQRAMGDGYLHVRPPESDEPGDIYVYDPYDPCPTLWTSEHFTVPADRRRLENRSDILYYQTAPLEEAVEVVGYPEVVLYATSSAPDTDFFARLVDEDPQGAAAANLLWHGARAASQRAGHRRADRAGRRGRVSHAAGSNGLLLCSRSPHTHRSYQQ